MPRTQKCHSPVVTLACIFLHYDSWCCRSWTVKYDWQSLLKGFSQRQSKVRKYKINLGTFVEHVFFNGQTRHFLNIKYQTGCLTATVGKLCFSFDCSFSWMTCLGARIHIYNSQWQKSRDYVCAFYYTLKPALSTIDLHSVANCVCIFRSFLWAAVAHRFTWVVGAWLVFAQIGTDNFQRLSLAIVYQQVGMEAVALARTNLLTALWTGAKPTTCGCKT